MRVSFAVVYGDAECDVVVSDRATVGDVCGAAGDLLGLPRDHALVLADGRGRRLDDCQLGKLRDDAPVYLVDMRSRTALVRDAAGSLSRALVSGRLFDPRRTLVPLLFAGHSVGAFLFHTLHFAGLQLSRLGGGDECDGDPW